MRGEQNGAALVADLGQQLVEVALNERVQAGDRFVEDQQLGVVHERLDEPELLPVAGRQLPNRPVELGVEALGELGDAAGPDVAVQPREEAEHRRAGQQGVETEVPGQVADAPPQREPAAGDVVPEQPRAARCWRGEPEQQAHGRTLAGPVGTEEPEDLPRTNLQIEVEQTAARPVVLGQKVSLNGRPDVSHGRTSYDCQDGGGFRLRIGRQLGGGVLERSRASPSLGAVNRISAAPCHW